jgi:uncharacterized protein (DUF362 family)
MTAPGAVVHVRRLTDAEDPERALEALLSSLGGLESRVGRGDLVLIKPNFVAPFAHATTDLRFVDFFVTRIRELGGIPVLGESSGFEFDTRSTFKVLGVDEFAKARKLDLVDFEDGAFTEAVVEAGLPPVPIAAIALDAKLVVNLPILKGHTITRVTGSVKNLFGLVARESRRYLHSHSLERTIAAIARRLPDALHVVDARRQLQRAVFAESRPLGYALAGTDPFAVDHLGARLLGVDPAWVDHLASAPAYELRGDSIASLAAPRPQNSVRQRLHRALYSALYWTDHAKHSLLGGESIIYDLHWYLGIHPVMRDMSPEQAVAVARSCPVDAIDAGSRSIRRRECRSVRCLQCYRDHPTLVRLGGLNRPRRGSIGA